MTSVWPTKMLADVCEVFADGDWIESKDQSDEGVRLIQTGNVGEGVFKDRVEKARYISESTFKRLHCSEIVEGDCLVSRLPDPVGRSCIIPDTGEKMITAVDCTILRFDPNELLPEFFNLYSQSVDYLQTVNSETSGTTRKRISRSRLGQVPIPVPPLAEQRRIVGILDEAFEGIATAKANAETNLQNARALFESYLQSVFAEGTAAEWERVTLATLLDRNWILEHMDGNHGGDYPRKDEFIDNGVPYISASCVDNDRVNMRRAKFLSTLRAGQLRKGFAKDKDVLFAHNATVGPVAILRTEDEKVVLGTSLTYYRCNPNHILPEYLAHYMRSFAFKTQYEQVMRQSTRNQVPITKQREFYHVVPPLIDQESMVGILDGLLQHCQKLATLYESKLIALDTLKNSLLDQAFTGKL